MPHEVIMPALGMAQDSGLIVAWLKSPGDAVKAGDALMEVETDKATMEVEAAHDGFLADVRAAEGETVPVGRIVALIAETADGADEAPAPAARAGDAPDAAAEAAEPDGEAALPEGHQVIMPALGMAQDSGIVVAWHKEPGEAVAEGDALLEVETDKATMEVEADRAGYLAAILAEERDDVPVGQVIAVISAEAPATPVRRAMAAAPTPARPEAAPARPEPDKTAERPPIPAPRPAEVSTATAPAGRILASPKARRLAAEEGLDLARLAAAGYPQPFHVADLETLRALPKSAAPAAAAAGGEVGVISAEIDAAAYDDFQAWLASVTDTPPDGPRLLAAFAAGAMRAARGAEGKLTIAAGALGAPAAMDDPDLAPLSAAPAPSEAPPALILRDLTGTALTAVKPAAAHVPRLTVTRRGDTLALHLAHDAAALPEEAALALVAGLAGRLSEPLRHLL
ncbi:pyruvate dehydrogenase [Rhodosalinus halophilus]|uniref:Pyruvate dehydrogenase n=1 Tax=Rhodosalinus halophilus TaxID=2259333 RepID=A0A365UD59_9RHOB|nr:biotin/lipoyl-containing protein [Rhodosalinus halophilus]RBI87468.1 pyruvate dehydrogenase [Rhodosalinus halophilus]